jgi:hypothetical protein
MTFFQAIRVAKLGQPVRRVAWSYSRTLQFSAGPQGTARAVGLYVDGATTRMLRNTDLTNADYTATDWMEA